MDIPTRNSRKLRLPGVKAVIVAALVVLAAALLFVPGFVVSISSGIGSVVDVAWLWLRNWRAVVAAGVPVVAVMAVSAAVVLGMRAASVRKPLAGVVITGDGSEFLLSGSLPKIHVDGAFVGVVQATWRHSDRVRMVGIVGGGKVNKVLVDGQPRRVGGVRMEYQSQRSRMLSQLGGSRVS